MSVTVKPARADRAENVAAPQRSKGAGKRFLKKLPSLIAIVILVIVMGYPLLWMFFNSLKSNKEFLTTPSYMLPQTWEWGNYLKAWETGNLAVTIKNSIIVTFPSLFLIVLFGTAAGYALEVMVFKGRGAILLAFLAGIMIPGQMIVLPLFTSFFNLGLSGGYLPLILIYTASGMPLTVFMMATYFRAIPKEMFEAAVIDGSTMLRSFFTIALPLMRNAIVTVAIIQFFLIWNDLLMALIFAGKRSLNTIQVGLLNFSGEYGATDYGPLFAAICITVGGIMVFYLFLNQRIMKGLAAGAVKG